MINSNPKTRHPRGEATEPISGQADQRQHELLAFKRQVKYYNKKKMPVPDQLFEKLPPKSRGQLLSANPGNYPHQPKLHRNRKLDC